MMKEKRSCICYTELLYSMDASDECFSMVEKFILILMKFDDIQIQLAQIT